MGTFGKGHHLHLIDGSAYIFRAYHALPPLTRKSDGLPVGAVAGFCNILWSEITRESGADAPTHLAVVFDFSSTTFRNEIYPLYKANRTEPPEDLRPQFPLTRAATRAFNVACLEIDGYEADDIIATLAAQATAAGGRTTIVSSDKDLMQLVGNGVGMRDPMKNLSIGVEEVFEKFGVDPARVVDVQALAGDSVDNVPGAPGIGLKTAAQLIQEFGSLEALLQRTAEIRQPKRREALEANAELIRISKRLVTLDAAVPLDITLDSLEVRLPDAEEIMAFLTQMEFRTLTRRVAERLKIDVPPPPQVARTAEGTDPDAIPAKAVPFEHDAYATIGDPDALAALIARIYDTGHVAVGVQSTSIDPLQARLVGLSFATAPGVAAYVPLGHLEGGLDLLDVARPEPGQVAMEAALTLLRPMFADPSILKIGQDIKQSVKLLHRYGVTLASVDDPQLMSYAMNAGRHYHGFDLLADTYLGHTPIAAKTLTGVGKSATGLDRAPIAATARLAGEEADVILRLWQRLKPRLHRDRVTTVYETLERPLIPVLAQMEAHGVLVDRDTLSRMSNLFAQRMAGLEDEIYGLAGTRFNVGSPKQLGEILFDTMKLPGGVPTKTGAWGTGADVLEDLAADGLDLPARILDWRQIAKLKTTYTDLLQTYINPETGRVHTSYMIAGSNTGRLASTEPNLQNIPIRSEEGRRIREAFIAPPNRVLVSLDYSQIELRILAHYADIPALKAAFAQGHDIHAMTASEMFGVPMDQMTKDIRSRAKAINFGVIYGISGFGLARNLRISRDEAQGFIDRYFERFPGIRAYMDDTIAFARAHGHVETLFGRRMITPEINARGPNAGNARRAAINAPIQGTAADVIRRAMIRMETAIRDLDARMLLQVHDELLFEVAEDQADALIARAKDVMEGAADPAVKLSVHLAVDGGKGRTWAEAH